MTHRAETLLLTPGKCRICGCTELRPCMTADAQGRLMPCAWVDEEQTLCSNLACIAEVPLNELIAMEYIEQALEASA